MWLVSARYLGLLSKLTWAACQKRQRWHNQLEVWSCLSVMGSHQLWWLQCYHANKILLTQQNNLSKYSQPLTWWSVRTARRVARTTFWFVDAHTDTHWKQYQLSLLHLFTLLVSENCKQMTLQSYVSSLLLSHLQSLVQVTALEQFQITFWTQRISAF